MGAFEKGAGDVVARREKITIAVPKSMPLIQRITEVSRQISEWIRSLDIPLNEWANELHLTKCEHDLDEHRYHYMIIFYEEMSPWM